MDLTKRIDDLAGKLESSGQIDEAYRLDVVANTLDKMISEVNSTLGETLGIPADKPSSFRHDFNKVIREHGITDNPEEAGYIIPDGNLLKLKAVDVGKGVDSLVSIGAIRMDHTAPGIRLGIGVKPTAAQKNRIERILELVKGPVTVNERVFEEGTKLREIIDFIKQRFPGDKNG
jgi:hypothetical protein